MSGARPAELTFSYQQYSVTRLAFKTARLVVSTASPPPCYTSCSWRLGSARIGYDPRGRALDIRNVVR